MDPSAPRFPLGSGLLLGAGLGALVDGIVLHQLLQWHQMTSGWYPNDTLENVRRNIVWDGAFHAFAWTLVVLGVHGLWRAASERRLAWTGRAFAGTLAMGWGAFNVVEGIVDHALLGIHRVNERVPPDERLAWDLAFLAFGAALLALGGWLWRTRGADAPRAGAA